MDHTAELIEKAHQGDADARALLVEENVGLVWCIVRRYSGRGTEAEDLFQIGSIGLLKAIDKFDLTYDVRFSTYAVPMISGEIRRFLRDDGMLKVSRSLKEISCKACQAKEEFTKKYNREPTIRELSEISGIGKEELVEAMEASAEVESLHRPVYKKDGSEVELLEKLEKEALEAEVPIMGKGPLAITPHGTLTVARSEAPETSLRPRRKYLNPRMSMRSSSLAS